MNITRPLQPKYTWCLNHTDTRAELYHCMQTHHQQKISKVPGYSNTLAATKIAEQHRVKCPAVGITDFPYSLIAAVHYESLIK